VLQNTLLSSCFYCYVLLAFNPLGCFVKSFTINALRYMMVVPGGQVVAGSNPAVPTIYIIYIKTLRVFFYVCDLRLQKDCNKIAKPRPKKRPPIKAAQG
jgi:hypothetical protein